MAAPISLQQCSAVQQTAAARCKRGRLTIRAQERASPGGNILVRAAVGALTEGLRLAGVGQQEYQAAAAAAPAPRALRTGDVAGVLRALRADYAVQYFVTGRLSDEIYEEDCVYADPTVSFSGRELYKRNLSLLVPFLWDASIELRSLKQLPAAAAAAANGSSNSSRSSRARSSSSSGSSSSSSRTTRPTWWQLLLPLGARGAPWARPPVQLLAEWRLTCWLRFPWAPYVEVNGTTTYTLNGDRNKIVSHVEAWDVSAAQALLLLLRPSERAVWRQRGRAGAER